MNYSDADKLKYGNIIFHNSTGEEFKFVQLQGAFLMCFDSKGRCFWDYPEKFSLREM